mmetsp:Transcript_18049/g.40035  ORF Transcript_18049/g.40035 Transcript_18049/m.40035 type:complete len:208 (+) Transcript_18049:228-851(+)
MKKKSVDSDLWDEVTDDVALEKPKMSLCQIDRLEQKEEATLAACKASDGDGGDAAATEKSGKKGKKGASSSAASSSSSGSGKRKSREGNLAYLPSAVYSREATRAQTRRGTMQAAAASAAMPALPPPQMMNPAQMNAMMTQMAQAGQAGGFNLIAPSPRWCPRCCCMDPATSAAIHVHPLHAASAAVPAGSCRRRSRRQGWRGRRCR